MDHKLPIIEHNLGKEYKEHKIFKELEIYSDFYDSLALSILGFLTPGIKSLVNLDSYAFSQ